jgi:hypothetical protein
MFASEKCFDSPPGADSKSKIRQSATLRYGIEAPTLDVNVSLNGIDNSALVRGWGCPALAATDKFVTSTPTNFLSRPMEAGSPGRGSSVLRGGFAVC